MEVIAGRLYIVATPIGNLEDITLRALDALKKVDYIAAEDTRRTVKLLNHYGIARKMVSFHEYSDTARREGILEDLRQGSSIALVSDAGTPLISDPGYRLIKECLENGIKVESLPGACAAITAVTLSGIDCSDFLFAGFLPTKSTARKKKLERMKAQEVSSVLYESPRRLKKTLADICEVYGGQVDICVTRELTKLHEENVYGTCDEVAEIFANRAEIKGEIVIVVGAAEKSEAGDEEIIAALQQWLAEGKTKKEAAALAAAQLFCPRNKVYNMLLKL